MQVNSAIDGRSKVHTENPDASLLEDLVQAISVGNVAALSRIYKLTSARVFAVAYFRLHSREDAEEIMADVYNHVWRHALSYDASRGSVLAWLTMMTRNRAIDRMRCRRKTISLDDEQYASLAIAILGASPGLEHVLLTSESSAEVELGLRCLSQRRQRLVRLAFFEGLTHSQISAAAGMPLGTVKSDLRRALRELRYHLKQRV